MSTRRGPHGPAAMLVAQLLADGGGGLRADPLAQRRVADAGVDAGEAGLGAALAEARGADNAQRAVDGAEHRAAGVALAGVGAALRVARADHRGGAEVAVGVAAVAVGRDRDLGLLEVGRQAAALGCRAPADDLLERARRPRRGLGAAGDLRRRL